MGSERENGGGSGRGLVVVESPAKARTLEKYLGDDFRVEASVGHVKDLPKSPKETELGVDVEGGFEPEWETIKGKHSVLKKLAKAAESAPAVYLATDPDREGEAIAYHIAEYLGYPAGNGDRFRRVVFHEITRDAVLDAFRAPEEIDMRLVEAQQARRILDRLVGYRLSPLLWKKIKPGLSAGRVQSVAVRLLVARERERRAFRTAEYWDLKAQLEKAGQGFEADLVSVGGERVAEGRDFDESTGRLIEGRDVVLLDGDDAESLRERLSDRPFAVTSVEERTSTRSPYAPFTTSSLQQEANRRLNMTASQTMSAAQRLYEAGHITYMRTDSVHLSEQAIRAVRNRVRERYGDGYLRGKPRRYRTKSKAAQEAHEAIRPAGTEMKPASELGLRGRQRALYDLVWKRTVATQMKDARQRHLTVLLQADDAEFKATGKILDFPGFFRAWVEGADDPEAALEDRDVLLPELEEGDEVTCRELEAVSHETRPPSRYTEASLVKEMEEKGIGRPSTYADIISRIQDRGYVEKDGKSLTPTWTAFAVTQLLEDHFPDLVDADFTAGMEDSLDRIAAGEEDWRSYLESFYSGDEGLDARLKSHEEGIDPREASTVRLSDLEPRLRIGRYGPFLEIEKDGDRVTASVPEGVAPADLSNEEAVQLLERKARGPLELGEDPESGKPVYLMTGRYGPYVQLGEQGEDGGKPKRTSLPEGLAFEDVDLETGLKLLSMPYELGEHPDDGKPVKAGLGRYGPYVVHDGDFRSLKKGDDVLEISLDRALELLSEPKRGRGRSRKGRELGPHPDDGEPVRALEGRYGPYVKHGDTNASLPDGMDVEDVTLEEAVDLIEMRRAKIGKSG